MRASALEFRLRVVIIAVVITLGFWSPWMEALGLGPRRSVLAELALELTRGFGLRFDAAAAIAILLGTAVAALAVVLRVWGTAYLGAATVNDARMQAGGVMADGPYRFVRNPLYWGSWLMVAAMGFAMPPTGAAVALTLLAVLFVRLILGEEAFLRERQGAVYEAYCARVPRLLPRLRTDVARGGVRPQWGRALLSEINAISVLVALGVFGWSYNNWRIIQAILIGFGVSLVTRAFVGPDAEG
ncbi:MAG: isoprenylcysteine carboxylmethyltransferase family protein [Terracidiphilus sp.]|nr:isoprenylcysteine carboxylmethyltransferase family protein [Terracidiphilus sp.]